MALLDIQAMDPARGKTAARCDDGSCMSIVLCDDDFVVLGR